MRFGNQGKLHQQGHVEGPLKLFPDLSVAGRPAGQRRAVSRQ